jgi:hypothetical protein
VRTARWVIRGSRPFSKRFRRIRAVANTRGDPARAKAAPLQAVAAQFDASPGCGVVGAGVSPAWGTGV